MSQYYELFVDTLDTALHQPGKISDICEKVEKMTGVKRSVFGQVFVAFFALYMVFGYFAQLICAIVGFVYPAYVSIKAIESSSKEDDTIWLTYWVVFASFSIVEFFSDFLLSWFPFYWLAKIIFLVWCYIPIKSNGSHQVYNKIILPFFLKNTGHVEKLNQKIEDQIKKVASNMGPNMKNE